MDPEQLAAAVAVADESLAAQTPDYGLQAAIAQDRPDLWAALASNPTAYPDLLTWLSGVHEPTVRLALEARGIAPQTEAPQTGEDARGQSRSEEPVDPQADQAEAGSQAVGEVSDEGAESRADGGASEEAVEPGADEAAPQSDGAVPEEEVAEEPAESQADSDAPAEEADEPQADEAEPQAEQTALADEAAPAEAPSPPVETPAPPPGSPLAAGFASRAVVASDNSFVPTPGQVVESYDPAPSSSTRSRKLVAVLAVLALLFVGGTGGWLLMDFIHRDAPVALSLPGTGHRAH